MRCVDFVCFVPEQRNLKEVEWGQDPRLSEGTNEMTNFPLRKSKNKGNDALPSPSSENVSVSSGFPNLSNVMGSNKDMPDLRNVVDNRLRSAAGRFVEFQSRLRRLDAALRIHNDGLRKAEASRANLMSALVNLSRGSPMHELVGDLSGMSGEEREVGDEQVADAASGNALSYAGLHGTIQETALPRLSRLCGEATTYVREWERTVSTRLAGEIRHVCKLHKEWVRYDKKLEALKVAVEKRLQKSGGTNPKDSEVAKISRNEQKLRTSQKDYHRNLVGAILLTEEVGDRGWKDLIPLMIRLIEFDVDTSHQTVLPDFTHCLNNVKESIKDLGHHHDMDYNGMRSGRLRVLLEEDPMQFVHPEDMQDLESIQPSLSTSHPSPVDVRHVGFLQDTFDTPLHSNIEKSRTAVLHNNGKTNGTASDSSPHSDVDEESLGPVNVVHVVYPPLAEVRVRKNEVIQPTNQPSPSAPPADIMSRAEATQGTPEKDRDDPDAPVLIHAQNVQSRERGRSPQRQLRLYNGPSDEDQGTLKYPTSIYINSGEDANDDVTALTPFPDLVSI